MRAIWAGALLTVYLGVTGLLLLGDIARAPRTALLLHVAVLAAVAAATWSPLVPRWLRSWAPLMALLFLYTELPLLIQAAGHEGTFDVIVAGWERSLFGTQPAVAWAARWQSSLWSEALHLAYLSYYAIVVAVPAALYFTGRHAEFHDAVFLLMLTFVACFIAYLVFPVAGPRYLWQSPLERNPGLIRSAAVALLEARSSRGTAFPSSHVAVSATQSLLALYYFRKRGTTIPLLTAGLAAGAVYGGFHYAVDVFAGLIVGLAIGAPGIVLLRRHAARQMNASAPT